MHSFYTRPKMVDRQAELKELERRITRAEQYLKDLVWRYQKSNPSLYKTLRTSGRKSLFRLQQRRDALQTKGELVGHPTPLLA